MKSEQYSDVGIHEQTIMSNFDPQYKLDVLVHSSENLPFKVDPLTMSSAIAQDSESNVS